MLTDNDLKYLVSKNVELKVVLCTHTHTHTNLRIGHDKISATLIGRDSMQLENNCHNHAFQVLLILAQRNFDVVAIPESYLKTWTIIAKYV
jgi:hypothetical protein